MEPVLPSSRPKPLAKADALPCCWNPLKKLPRSDINRGSSFFLCFQFNLPSGTRASMSSARGRCRTVLPGWSRTVMGSRRRGRCGAEVTRTRGRRRWRRGRTRPGIRYDYSRCSVIRQRIQSCHHQRGNSRCQPHSVGGPVSSAVMRPCIRLYTETCTHCNYRGCTQNLFCCCFHNSHSSLVIVWCFLCI